MLSRFAPRLRHSQHSGQPTDSQAPAITAAESSSTLDGSLTHASMVVINCSAKAPSPSRSLGAGSLKTSEVATKDARRSWVLSSVRAPRRATSFSAALVRLCPFGRPCALSAIASITQAFSAAPYSARLTRPSFRRVSTWRRCCFINRNTLRRAIARVPAAEATATTSAASSMADGSLMAAAISSRLQVIVAHSMRQQRSGCKVAA